MEIDINPTKKQTVSDDPELAKVLAGVNNATINDDTQFQEDESVEEPEAPTQQLVENLMPTDIQPTVFPGIDLDMIKNHALEDLRPLVEKLTVSNEEKFDIYLLLLRSSDDNTLVEPAYNAARSIEDETKRANALLDIIKEVDYFKSKA